MTSNHSFQYFQARWANAPTILKVYFLITFLISVFYFFILHNLSQNFQQKLNYYITFEILGTYWMPCYFVLLMIFTSNSITYKWYRWGVILYVFAIMGFNLNFFLQIIQIQKNSTYQFVNKDAWWFTIILPVLTSLVFFSKSVKKYFENLGNQPHILA